MQPVIRALDILTALSGRGSGRSLAQIAEVVEIPLSTAHRFMRVLEDKGFVIRTAGKRYLLGPSVRALVTATETERVREVAEPVMRRLIRDHGETVFLAELIGSEVICVSFLEGTRSLRHHVQVGSRLPLNASSSARMILAGLEESEIDDLISRAELERYTARTITDPRELKRHLLSTKASGYDVCDDEMENHVWAVGVPLHDVNGALPYALTIVAPLSSVESAPRRTELIEAAREAAADISVELGGRFVASA
ncbi:IclR family transcriptional regulator (plasmid) [Arthrobacter sp. UC242_113]|uniref:IclR family transcriptional regulator n=1 Tax=Arthrobacter sp. UC242_113 TaxID=3374550 RepID=UPI00375664D2